MNSLTNWCLGPPILQLTICNGSVALLRIWTLLIMGFLYLFFEIPWHFQILQIQTVLPNLLLELDEDFLCHIKLLHAFQTTSRFVLSFCFLNNCFCPHNLESISLFNYVIMQQNHNLLTTEQIPFHFPYAFIVMMFYFEKLTILWNREAIASKQTWMHYQIWTVLVCTCQNMR